MEDEGQEGEEGPGVNVTVMCSCQLTSQNLSSAIPLLTISESNLLLIIFIHILCISSSLPLFLPVIQSDHFLLSHLHTLAMASSALFSAPTFSSAATTLQKHLPHQSFQGLRPLSKPTDLSLTIPRMSTRPIPKRSAGVVRAELNTSLVISLSTGLSLFLGRFVFFNFQRENVAKQVPQQNGLTHFEAGDSRAKEYVSLLKSNDPVGFNIVDVLAWGSIGHIVAYYILATSSNGYDPKFFG
ncbi:photosystem I reaction center subunit V, chloroplastic [Vitis riparia]|uniref:photosystem I reaction center subunit V, chloroplastic n=1 Tax=Vitis riparia TaxID=96939 RepID=UPI00155A1E45|nr:photosystem I reaction center subunit V, chloroplastic [Vitis riparia]